MILTRDEIREAVDKGEIKFDPPLQPRQWGDASVDLRLGYKFTKLKESDLEIPLAKGIKQISDSGLWHEETFPHHDSFGKRRPYVIYNNEFILAQTLEKISIPRNLIARVEGRSTYARVGLSMHETAPWLQPGLQPGWEGQITLEIKNSGPLKIQLMPFDDMPAQVTFSDCQKNFLKIKDMELAQLTLFRIKTARFLRKANDCRCSPKFFDK